MGNSNNFDVWLSNSLIAIIEKKRFVPLSCLFIVLILILQFLIQITDADFTLSLIKKEKLVLCLNLAGF